MTLKELLDVINRDRYREPDNGTESIEILGDDGEPEVTARISSKVLKTIENRNVESVRAIDTDVFGVWLEDK